MKVLLGMKNLCDITDTDTKPEAKSVDLTFVERITYEWINGVCVADNLIVAETRVESGHADSRIVEI